MKGIDVAIAGVIAETEVVNYFNFCYHFIYSYFSFRYDSNSKKIHHLCAEKEKLDKEVKELSGSSPSSLWNRDLDALEKELDNFGASSEAQLEDSVAKARPKRESRTRAVYMESELEAEEENEKVLSEYSNFEEEDDELESD